MNLSGSLKSQINTLETYNILSMFSSIVQILMGVLGKSFAVYNRENIG